MRPSFKQIEFFWAVMVTGSVSGAAKVLHVSQPAVSRVIKYMEYKIGMPLFVRKNARLFATPEAKALFKEIEPIHRRLETLDESIGRIMTGANEQFRIGTSPSLGRYVIPKILSELKKTYPDIEMKIDVLSIPQLKDYLSFSEGECVCTIFPLDLPNVDLRLFSKGRLISVMQRNHKLAKKESIVASDFSDVDLIGFETNTPHGDAIDVYFRKYKANPRISIKVRFAETACALADHGLGVAIVDEFTMSGYTFGNLVRKPLDHEAPFRIHFYRPAQRAPSKIGAIFELLLEEWRPDILL